MKKGKGAMKTDDAVPAKEVMVFRYEVTIYKGRHAHAFVGVWACNPERAKMYVEDILAPGLRVYLVTSV